MTYKPWQGNARSLCIAFTDTQDQRVHRDGQKKQVYVYRLLATGTIEGSSLFFIPASSLTWAVLSREDISETDH